MSSHGRQSANSQNLTRASVFKSLASKIPAERESAWALFRERYAPVIAGFAANYGAKQQDIDDIIQDVLTSFLNASDTFVYDPAKGRFRGWLKTCTVRAAIRRAGKNLRFRGIPFDELPDVELAVEDAWNDIWEQQIVSSALILMRSNLGDSLAFRAFEQYVLLDRDATVVALELDTSVNNVHQAKLRMTKKLREVVQQLRDCEE
jgi:RNA polymerase sigma factor (sigma-70 family)